MARKRIDRNAMCRVEITFRDGHKEFTHWTATYDECKKKVNTFKRQDKHGLVGDVKCKYRVVEAR